ncbi:hypothetical protein DPMN_050121 [Dreissena polymorpha]|uniref:Uncharacterized protein n=1 Tax=Dreissena polymorpha TaxID=45954 RepID=A0A9D4CFI4_DREPO|nr:hypothetical protein DPMN_050121 [Dreissena polymorpha]
MHVYLMELHILSGEGSRSSFKVKCHIRGHSVSQTHLVLRSFLVEILGKRTNPSLIREISNLLLARAYLLLISPRSLPFLPPQPPMPEIPVGARLFHFSNRWLQISFGRMGSFSGYKRPDFSIRKKAFTFSRSDRTGISASTYSTVHSRALGKTCGRKGS